MAEGHDNRGGLTPRAAGDSDESKVGRAGEGFVRPVAALATDPAAYGLKAVSLGGLAAHGFPVPAAFCISTAAYVAHLARAGIAGLADHDVPIEQPPSDPSSSDDHDGVSADPLARAREIRRAILRTPMDPDLIEQISAAHAALGGGAVAVRSSATVEDGESRSFAGQHGTYFRADTTGCLQAVLHCWASLWTRGAVLYRTHRAESAVSWDDPPPDHRPAPAMAVIVQRVVAAEAAGVAFTADPFSGDRQRIVIESCLGLGESLVSGRVAPDRFTLHRGDFAVVQEHVSIKEKEVLVGADGRVSAWAVSAERQDRPSLTGSQLSQLAGLCLAVEAFSGDVVDVEWALADESFFLLQARPITTGAGGAKGAQATYRRGEGSSGGSPGPAAPGGPGGGAADPPGGSVASGAGRAGASHVAGTSRARREHRTLPPQYVPAARYTWTSMNSGEVLPGVASPMTWSIVRSTIPPILKELFGLVGVQTEDTPVMGLVGGRAYFNADLVRAGMAAFPAFGRLEADEVLGGHQGGAKGGNGGPPGGSGGARGRNGGANGGDAGAKGVRGAGGPEDAVDVPGRLALAVRLPRLLLWLRAHDVRRSRRFVDSMAAETADIARRAGLALLGAEAGEEPSPGDAELLRALDELSGGLPQLVEVIGYSGVAMAHHSNLRALCARWLGDGNLAGRLVAGVGGVDSAEAGLAVRALAAEAAADPGVRQALEKEESFAELELRLRTDGDAGRGFLASWYDFIARHGHHARGEIEVMNPRWAEEPDHVLALVRTYLASLDDADPLEAYRRRASAGRACEQECLQELHGPFRRAVFRHVLSQAREGARAREGAKSEAVRRLSLIRQVLLRLGARMEERGMLRSRGDVFFLEIEEVARVWAGGGVGPAGLEARSVVCLRRALWAADQAWEPPPVVRGWIDDAGRVRPDHSAVAVEEAAFPPVAVGEAGLVVASPRTFRGLGVSPGVVEGPARVIRQPALDDAVRPGEILVVPYTDPGWSPYLLAAAGLVTDMGGLLSHGSIIAREFGLPAVVNVGEASRVLETGQLLRVDADLGEVQVIG